MPPTISKKIKLFKINKELDNIKKKICCKFLIIYTFFIEIEILNVKYNLI
jgi:hypothetical protein